MGRGSGVARYWPCICWFFCLFFFFFFGGGGGGRSLSKLNVPDKAQLGLGCTHLSRSELSSVKQSIREHSQMFANSVQFLFVCFFVVVFLCFCCCFLFYFFFFFFFFCFFRTVARVREC